MYTYILIYIHIFTCIKHIALTSQYFASYSSNIYLQSKSTCNALGSPPSEYNYMVLSLQSSNYTHTIPRLDNFLFRLLIYIILLSFVYEMPL